MPAKPARPVRVAIYSRVSTDHQTTENQERELHAIADRMGWTVVKVYRDQGVSGAKSRENRPAFDVLCKDASRRQFELIAAWSVDRLGRSLQDLVGFLTEVHALGINLFLHQQGIRHHHARRESAVPDDGRVRRVRACDDPRARQVGGWSGPGRRARRLDASASMPGEEAAILADLQSRKAGIMKLAAAHGVGVGTVQRIKGGVDEAQSAPEAPGRLTLAALGPCYARPSRAPVDASPDSTVSQLCGIGAVSQQVVSRV